MRTIFHANRKRMQRDTYYVRVYEYYGIVRYQPLDTRERREDFERSWTLYGQKPLYRINVRRKAAF